VIIPIVLEPSALSTNCRSARRLSNDYALRLASVEKISEKNVKIGKELGVSPPRPNIGEIFKG
jgi:hypothetical protein